MPTGLTKRRPPTPPKFFPSEPLRIELEQKLGLSRDEHEYRKLRTLLYKSGGTLPDRIGIDDLARLVLEAAARPD